MTSDVIMEDDDVIVSMPQVGFTPGHVVIRPAGNFLIVEETPQEVFEKMWMLGNRLCGVLFEAFECDGTNLLIQNGVAAGQVDETVILHVIPRYENDGLSFAWDATEVDDRSLDAVQQRFRQTEEMQRERVKKQERKQRLEEPQKKQKTTSSKTYAEQFKRGY